MYNQYFTIYHKIYEINCYKILVATLVSSGRVSISEN